MFRRSKICTRRSPPWSCGSFRKWTKRTFLRCLQPSIPHPPPTSAKPARTAVTTAWPLTPLLCASLRCHLCQHLLWMQCPCQAVCAAVCTTPRRSLPGRKKTPCRTLPRSCAVTARAPSCLPFRRCLRAEVTVAVRASRCDTRSLLALRGQSQRTKRHRSTPRRQECLRAAARAWTMIMRCMALTFTVMKHLVMTVYE